jgi:hypothetical protein
LIGCTPSEQYFSYIHYAMNWEGIHFVGERLTLGWGYAKFEDTKWVIRTKAIAPREVQTIQRSNENEQTMIYKTLHIKRKVEHREPCKTREWNQVFRKGQQLLLHEWHLWCYSSYNPVLNHQWGNDGIIIRTNPTFSSHIYSLTEDIKITTGN